MSARTTYEELEIRGVSEGKLRGMLRRGEAIRIAKGLYTSREPTPFELANIICTHWPHAVLDAESAAQIHAQTQLTLPLKIAAPSIIARSRYFSSRRVRSKNLGIISYVKFRVVSPIVAAGAMANPRQAQTFLESLFRGKDGYEKFRTQVKKLGRLPHHTKHLLKSTATGSDSPAERFIFRALTQAGFLPADNQKIGNYYWDIVLEKFKVAIEIDGYEHHNRERRSTFIRDRWKANEATLLGYTVLRFSGSCIKHHLSKVVDQIISACRRRPFLPAPVWYWHTQCVHTY